MTSIFIYVVLVTIGECAAIGLGLVLDDIVPGGWGVVVAIALFFGVLVAMWPVTVFITERWFGHRNTIA